MVTSVKSATQRAEGSWAVTATPARTSPLIAMVWEPSWCQEVASGE